jgi:hypothetical protein
LHAATPPAQPSTRSRRRAADEVGAPVEAALSAHARRPRACAAGERERAAGELQRAAREFEARGALRYRDEAERELRKLGHHIHRAPVRARPTRSGIESLTERELQLARLVVDRKTNPKSQPSFSSARRRSRLTCATSSESRRRLARRSSHMPSSARTPLVA